MSRQEINDTRLAHSRLSGECQFIATIIGCVNSPMSGDGLSSQTPVRASFSQCSNHRLYQVSESLTPEADSRIGIYLIHHGKQLLGEFAMSTPVPLRSDFDTIGLRMLARRSRDPDQTRRLLA